MIKTIEDNLYRVRIHFVYKENCDNSYKLISKKGNYCERDRFNKLFKSAGFVAWASEQDIFMVLTEEKACVETLAHEVFHLVDNIFSDKGLKLTDASAEAYAYYMGWLTQQAANFCVAAEQKFKSTNKRVKLMKAKPKMVTKAELKKYAAKDKKEDMKMIKAAVKKAKKK